MKPPHIKTQRLKEIRQIEKRQQELYQQLWDLGYERLEKPIKHGWYRELMITDNVFTYKNANAIIEVYKKIRPWYWGITRERAQKEWDRQCSLFMISRDKPTISKKQYNKLSDQAKKYCVIFKYKTGFGNSKTRFYVNLPKGCYHFQYRRAYITHRKKIDPQIISEIDFLEKKLTKKGYYDLYKSYENWDPGWSHYLAYEVRKREKRIKRNVKMLKRESIEDLIKDNVLWEIN